MRDNLGEENTPGRLLRSSVFKEARTSLLMFISFTSTTLVQAFPASFFSLLLNYLIHHEVSRSLP